MPKNAVGWLRDNPNMVLVLAGLGLLTWIALRSPARFGRDVGGAGAKIVTGAATGVVDEVGKIVGVPSVDDVTDDPYVARYIIDHPRGGYFQASFYTTPVALARGGMLPEFSGRMPPEQSRIYAEFPPSGSGGASGDW